MHKISCLLILVTMLLTFSSACGEGRDATESTVSTTLQESDNTNKSGGTTMINDTTTDTSQTDPKPSPLIEQLNALISTAMNTVPQVTDAADKNPKSVGDSHITAIYYSGMKYQNLESTRVFAYIGFPSGATEQDPVPAVVCVHGGSGKAYAEWVEKWTDRGYAAIAMDTYGNHPGGSDTFIRDSLGGPNIDYMNSGNSKIEDQWMYHAVTQAILAGNILRQDPRVIKDKVGITGISWGAHIVSNVISHDSRFAFAVPVYGCAFLPDSRGVFAGHFRNTNAALLWDPSERLKNCTVRTLWFNGDSDTHFSIDATQKSYEAFDNSEILIHHAYTHSHTAGWNPSEIYAFADSAARGEEALVFPAYQPTGRGKVSFELNIPSGSTNIKVTVYYRTTLMGEWNNVSGTFDNGKVEITIPDAAHTYYVSIRYRHNNTILITSSQLVQ